MTTPIVAQVTKIYEVGDIDPSPMVADGHFHQVTITTQPLDIPVGDEDKPIKDILTSTNAVVKENMTGKNFDANEKSILRLHNAVTYIKEHSVESIPWSTADVGSGVMVECTAAEIIEAHKLAVENMTAVWSK